MDVIACLLIIAALFVSEGHGQTKPPPQPLDIPFLGPFGGVRLQPGADGTMGVGLHSGFNVGGSGYDKSLNFVSGPGGQFGIGTSGGVLVDGKNYGPNTMIMNGRNGWQFGTGLDVARPTPRPTPPPFYTVRRIGGYYEPQRDRLLPLRPLQPMKKKIVDEATTESSGVQGTAL